MVLQKRYLGFFTKMKIFDIFGPPNCKNDKKWQKIGIFLLLRPIKIVKKIILEIFTNNVFEEPYKDALYQKLANFDQN